MSPSDPPRYHTDECEVYNEVGKESYHTILHPMFEKMFQHRKIVSTRKGTVNLVAISLLLRNRQFATRMVESTHAMPRVR